MPGMITLIARKGKLVYMHSSGVADIETKQPLKANTIMRFYSMTKPVTSVCAMVLYERGFFQLDEPISHHLPSFASPRVLQEDGTTVPAEREITVRDLLMHTAGLSYGDGDNDVDELYMGANIGSNTPSDMPLAEFVDRLGRLPLTFHPGESWRYSYATDVLGRLLEVLSGLPLDELLHREIFEPLGMVDSCFSLATGDRERCERFAQVYEADEEENIEVGELARRKRRFERSNAFLLHRLRDPALSASFKPESAPGNGNPPGQERDTRRTEDGGRRTRTAVISAAATPGPHDTPDCPKALSPLAGEPMLVQILRQLRLGGITRVVVITGFRGAQVRDTLSSHAIVRELDVIFVDVGETYSDGFARSLLAAAPILDGEDWLLCCADRVFHHSLVEDLRSVSLSSSALPGPPSPKANGRRQRGGPEEGTEGAEKPNVGTVFSYDAVMLAEPEPGRAHRSDVKLSLTASAHSSGAWKRDQLRLVDYLWEGSDGDEDEASPGSPIDCGLFKCSGKMFDVMASLASTLPHFSMWQALSKVAEQGRLAAMTTGGRKWFALDGVAGEIDQRVVDLVRGRNKGAAPMPPPPSSGQCEAPRVVKAESFSRVSPEQMPGDLSADRPAKPRFHVLSREDGGEYINPSRKVTFLSGGAGMLSTAHDYARFAQMLLNKGELDGKRILSRKTLEYMTRNQLPLEGTGAVRRADIDAIATDSGFNETSFDGIGFGLGWSVVQDPIKASLLCSQGEYGWGGWASTFFAVDPSEDMFVLSLAQLAPSDRYPIRRQLRCLLYQALI